MTIALPARFTLSQLDDRAYSRRIALIAYKYNSGMIDLYNKTTSQLLGTITEADLKVLIDALEEEGIHDQDYFIDNKTIDVIADGKATEHLVRILRAAVGTSGADGVDIRWQRR